MAKALHTFGVMSALRRTKSGAFEIANAIPVDGLTEENIENCIVKTQEFLPFESIFVKENSRIFNGLTERIELPDGEYKIFQGENFYGIGEVKNGLLKTKTKLC